MGPLSGKKTCLLFKQACESAALIIASYHCLREERLKKSYLTDLGDSFYYYQKYYNHISYWGYFDYKAEEGLAAFCEALGLKEFWLANPSYHASELLPPENVPQIDLVAMKKNDK